MTEVDEAGSGNGLCGGGSPSGRGNRAISPFFRVFGGRGKREIADGFDRTGFSGMHEVERWLLGAAVPLTVWVAVAEILAGKIGVPAGGLVALPVAFVVLNGLALVIPGRKMAVQFWCWLGLLAAWGWWRAGTGGVTGGLVWGWVAFAVLNVAALLILGFGRTLRIAGSPGLWWRFGWLVALHVAAFVSHWYWGWGWAVACGAGIAMVCCAAVLRPSSQWLGPVVWHGEGKEILMTIDDGPDPEDTPRLLDLLDERGERAIFFMIGEKVGKFPELAREVVRRGHEIGNHTMTHPQATFWCAGPWRTWREIEECQNAIREATGVTPVWFRAPVGHRNLFTHPVAATLGLKVMAWSRRGYDAVSADLDGVLGRILPVRRGDIVLMHEGTRIAEDLLRGILDAKRG